MMMKMKEQRVNKKTLSSKAKERSRKVKQNKSDQIKGEANIGVDDPN